jgi:hypothetical protein
MARDAGGKGTGMLNTAPIGPERLANGTKLRRHIRAANGRLPGPKKRK